MLLVSKVKYLYISILISYTLLFVFFRPKPKLKSLFIKGINSELINHNKAFLPQLCGFKPPGNIYTHIVGIDIVRTAENDFFVLEDNARVPSGVSYMFENR